MYRTKEEKESLVNEIEERVADGESVKEAAAKVGIAWGSYYAMLKALGREPALRGTHKKKQTAPVLHRAVLHEIFSQQGGESQLRQQGEDAKIANEGQLNAGHEEPPMVILIGRESSINQALVKLASLWR